MFPFSRHSEMLFITGEGMQLITITDQLTQDEAVGAFPFGFQPSVGSVIMVSPSNDGDFSCGLAVGNIEFPGKPPTILQASC